MVKAFEAFGDGIRNDWQGWIANHAVSLTPPRSP